MGLVATCASTTESAASAASVRPTIDQVFTLSGDAVADLVTSNQPGTAGEWTRRAYPYMMPAEQASDVAWMAVTNNEHIDVNEVSRTIDCSPPPSMPHIILVSTERY